MNLGYRMMLEEDRTKGAKQAIPQGSATADDQQIAEADHSTVSNSRGVMKSEFVW